MAQPTRPLNQRAVQALVLPLLALLVAACSPDTGETAGGDITSAFIPEDSDGDTSSTTEPAEAEPGEAEPVEAAVLPASMWGVEAGSYDLVRIDTASGEVTQRIAGWGAEAASSDQEAGAQALQEIAAAGDSLWVADCCEPAVGSVFRVDPATTDSIPDTEVRVNGISPVLSPDGTLLAVSVLDIGVAIHDATTGEQLVSPELVGAVVSPPQGVDAPFFSTPVAWIDGDTVAVAVNGDAASTVTMVSITQPSAPSAVGPIITVDGPILDGATRSDGALVVAVGSAGGDAVAGQVYSTETGAQDAAFTLDAATTAIDYDASGTFLLVARENLPPTWQGVGETGELGDTPLVFAAWDDRR